MPPDAGAAGAARCGVVALLGLPNAGKSTLVNALAGHKLAITAPKAQTTRQRLLAIAMADQTQLLLVDTPGVFEPRRRLDRAMVADALEAAQDADRILLLLDSKAGLTAAARALIERAAAMPAPVILVLNKIDLVPRPGLLALAAEANAIHPFPATFMVSALTGDGLCDLRDALAAAMPEGPFLYPPDQLTNAPARALAAELTREQLVLQLGAELPYATAVLPETFEERPDGSALIRQQILVERNGQKAIVLGRGGARIRAIGTAARKAIAEALGHPVQLILHVRVEPGWPDDAARLRELGFRRAG
ncbi:GTPase Era [Thermaurantiacus sp.]